MGKTRKQAIVAAIVDDAAMSSLNKNEKKRKAPQRAGRRKVQRRSPLLAIEDGDVSNGSSDGESSGSQSKGDGEVGKPQPPKGLIGTKVDPFRLITWGRFEFHWVRRRIAQGRKERL